MIASPDQTQWTVPARPIHPSTDEVHVWLADLDVDPYECEQLARYLSPDELERAARIRMPRDRQRWIVARGTLRMLLSEYLDVNPRLVEIGYGSQGKPFAAMLETEDLQFNLAHSNGLAMYAFTVGRDVGIDIECFQPGFDEMPVAERLFTLEETAFVASQTGDDRQRAFLRCWTAKEAYLKARGLGLSTRLNQVQVSFAARNQVRVLDHQAPIAPREWSMTILDPTLDCVATLAVNGHDFQLRTWLWKPPFRPATSPASIP